MLFGTSSFKPSWSDYGLRSLAIYGLTVVVVWRLWRLWRFTIRPYFKSDTPKELPYMIPCRSKQCNVTNPMTLPLTKIPVVGTICFVGYAQTIS
jgi:hypothetical protein